MSLDSTTKEISSCKYRYYRSNIKLSEHASIMFSPVSHVKSRCLSPSSRSNASCTWRSLTASNELVASSSRSTLQRCLGNMDQFIMPSRKTYWIHEEPAWFRMVIHWWDMLCIVTIVMLQVFVRPVNFNFNVFTSWVWLWISVQGFKLCNSRTAGSLKSARAIAMRCFLRFDQDSPSRIRNEIQSSWPPLQTLLTTQITFQYELSLDELSNYIIISTRIQNPGLKRLKRPKTWGRNTPKTISACSSWVTVHHLVEHRDVPTAYWSPVGIPSAKISSLSLEKRSWKTKHHILYNITMT